MDHDKPTKEGPAFLAATPWLDAGSVPRIRTTLRDEGNAGSIWNVQLAYPTPGMDRSEHTVVPRDVPAWADSTDFAHTGKPLVRYGFKWIEGDTTNLLGDR
jgi:hypothetical protein